MKGEIRLPGDKSISHRIAMLASLADGPCRFRNFGTGADCSSTLECLSALGSEITRSGEIVLHPHPLRSPGAPLDCGNSGSTLRMLAGLLAGQGTAAELTGDESLRSRPMRRVADPLRKMGAVLDLRDDEYAPVVLREGVKQSIVYESPVSSAQVKSAVLLAGLRFPGTRITEPVPSRDHTERLLVHLAFSPASDVRIPAFTYDVPGDPSSAAFFVVGALLQPDSELWIRDVLVNEYRIGFLRILRKAGAIVEEHNRRLVQNEPVADLRVVSGGIPAPIFIEPGEVSSVIDEIPVLSMLGARCGFEVRGAGELRHKESDRIAAMVTNLRSFGLLVEEWPDGYRVEPGNMRSGVAQTFHDHRIAMAFAAAGHEVDDPDCARISFPEFFDTLRML